MSRGQQKRSAAQLNYLPRMIVSAWLLAVTALSAVDLTSRALWACWAIGLLWAHVAYWTASRAHNVRDAERNNVLLDNFWYGMIIAFNGFSLWPMVAIAVMAILNGVLFSGIRFMLQALFPLALGVAAAVLIFGFDLRLASGPAVTALSVGAILVWVSLIAATYHALHQRQRETRKALALEERKSSDLLHNVLPAPIVERLKSGERPITDSFAEVTVIFADLVEFTPMAERLGPKGTVMLLNDLYQRFDAVAAKFGVEKIETTGDGYLAVAGAPTMLARHTAAAADFALALMDATADCAATTSEQVQLRIGLHMGPIYGGVVGDSRFHYKIFGDTVNIASRVQGQATPGRILVSDAVQSVLLSTHTMQERGAVELKGHGSMYVHWLMARG